jgi:hypothetical protein
MAEPPEETPKPAEGKVATSEMEDRFPDVDKPHLEAIIQLLYHLGVNVDDIHNVNATPYVEVEVGHETWLVMSDQEADECAEESVIDTFEEGGEKGFTVEWKDFVLNEGDFDTTLDDTVQNYIDNIREEPSNDPTTFDNKLDEEMVAKNVASEEEFADQLKEDWLGNSTPIEWYIEEFGSEAFKEFAQVDTTKLAKYIIETDGRGSVIVEQGGDEVELPNDYYAYKTA